MPVIIVAAALLGAAVGSFLNVAIHRIPRGASVLRPASSCPGCGVRIRPRDNVPIVSWLVLRGRCANCREPISVRYPVVELVTAVLFVLLALRFSDGLPELPAYLAYASASVALAAVDISENRLPNRLLYPAGAATLCLLVAAAVIDADLSNLFRGLLGGLAVAAPFLLMALGRPGSVGMGDVKYLFLTGAVLGYLSWRAVLLGALAIVLIAGAVGCVVMLRRPTVRGRGAMLPMAPAISAGALVTIFAGASTGSAWLSAIHVR